MDEQSESAGLESSRNRGVSEAGRGLEEMVETLAHNFLSHPGFMWTPAGFDLLHADWPAYPLGHGLRPALQSLGEFPVGTRFYQLDKIDQSTLFIVGRKPVKDAFAPHFLHLAVWDADIRECSRRGFVDGVEDDGTFLRFPEGAMTLTPEGARAALIQELTRDVDPGLLATVEGLLYAGRYDSAVREAAIYVELALRQATRSNLHGMALVDQGFGDRGLLVPEDLPNAHRLALRSMFRAYFAYVRNEYAHDFPPTDAVTACRLVRRSGGLIRALSALNNARSGG